MVYLLALAILISPFAPGGAAITIAAAMVAAILRPEWRQSAFSVAGLTLVAVCAGIAGAVLTRGPGLPGSLQDLLVTERWVDGLDYAVPFLALATFGLCKYRAADLRLLQWSLLLTVPTFLFLAAASAGWGIHAVWAWPDGWNLLGAWSEAPVGNRYSTGFQSANFLGTWAATLVAVGAALIADLLRGTHADEPRPPRDLRWGIELGVAGALTAGAALLMYLSGSRGAWLAALVAILAIAVVRGVSWRVVVGACLVGLLFAGAVAADLGPITSAARAVVPDGIESRIVSLANQQSIGPREDLWRCGLQQAWDNPWKGVGIDGFARPCSGGDPRYQHAHNVYIHSLAEMGLIYGALFLGLIAMVLLVGGVRLREGPDRGVRAGLYAGFVALAVAGFTDQVLFRSGEITIQWIVCLAVTASVARLTPGARFRHQPTGAARM